MDIEDALNLFEALAEFLPWDSEAHLQLGYLYAVRDDSSRSALEFNSAFENSSDYLLYDIAPFAMALRMVKGEDSLEFRPPRVLRQKVPPPRSMESRRGSEQGELALVIDHRGKVVAARIAQGATRSISTFLISMISAKFQPAELNGIPVPALLLMGGSSAPSSR
jgi:hypothetical protein